MVSAVEETWYALLDAEGLLVSEHPSAKTAKAAKAGCDGCRVQMMASVS